MGDNFDSTYKLLFRKYYANLLFYATRIVGEEEAEDVVQDVFVGVNLNEPSPACVFCASGTCVT